MASGSSGIHIAGYVFAPRLLPTAAYLLLLMLLLSLGHWQLDRADQKRAMLAERAAATRAPVVDLNEVTATLATHEYRRVTANGTFDEAHQFLLDNRIQDGQVGYRVLTPLRLDGLDRAVLVDRGFVPIVGDRQTPPALPPVDPQGPVTGRVSRGPSVGLRLGDPSDQPMQWPRRIQYMDFDYMQSTLDYPLGDYLLVEGALTNEAVAQRTGRDAWRFGPERHDGYAVQWFSLAGALTLIWLIVNTRREQRGGTT
ncbi:SURF1 family protein [Spiribacter onubensis]|uniref:SURF1-like protein n=1 Tax=Spiribacter onubensis TaxID=3122420 RepID=A0ABV3S9L3_9GAMM